MNKKHITEWIWIFKMFTRRVIHGQGFIKTLQVKEMKEMRILLWNDKLEKNLRNHLDT